MLKKVLPPNLRFIFGFMTRDKSKLAIVFLLCVFASVFNIVEPLLAKRIVDNAFQIEDERELLAPAALWLAIFTAKSCVQYFAKRLNLRYKKAVVERLKVFLFNDILQKPAQFFHEHSPAYIVSRINNDVETLDGLMLTNLLSRLWSALESVVILWLMSRISVSLTAIAVLLKLLELYINLVFPLKKLYKEHNEALAVLDKEMLNALTCVKLIKAANKAQDETQRYRQEIRRYLQARWARDTVNIVIEVISRFAIELSYPLVVIIGGLFIFYGWTTIGAVMAFLLYFQKLIPLFNNAAYIVPIFKIAQAASERIYEIVALPKENAKGIPQAISVDSIEFRHVGLAYGQKIVLNDFNMRLSPNKVTALVGLSGAGKSSVANMLLGFVRLTSGKILLNGKDLNAYDLAAIRNSIALVTQDDILLSRSLQENILYCCKPQDNWQNELTKALRAANVGGIIDRLPQGLATPVLENGVNLSGGERQRVCIAREMLKQAPVNIFDEATSALDAVSEQIVINNLQKIKKRGIVLLITHKLCNVRDADIVYVLDEGKIVEAGTHSELMENKGFYYTLYLEQNKETRDAQ